MTNFQKAFCIMLSICFFGVLAILPTSFFTEENVYRHLPLYRFLEKKAQNFSYEDRETYEKIAGENGRYLGKQIESEQQAELEEREESEEQEGSEQQTEPQVGSEQQMRSDREESDVAVEDQRLADFDHVLSQFYIVDPATETNAEQLDAQEFLKQDLTIVKDTDTPQILIYHSHSQEAFADSQEGVEADTIVGVGEYLAKILTEKYGYQVIHLKERFDMAGGELDRSSAYDYAREYLETFLQENPDIQVVIDLHRDGISEDRHLVTEINGKPTAQILFYNGLSYTVNKGSLAYLPNPYIEDNLAFSFQLEYQAAQDYPEFYRGIYLAAYRYNLHFRSRSILLEAGAQTNTVEEVKNAMEPFADILDKVLQGK